MSVLKRDGKWYAYVYQGVKDGKEQREYSKAFDKKVDAQLAELELKKKVLETNHLVIDKASFGYLAEAWLATRLGNVAESTYKRDKYYYEHYIKERFKSDLVKDIEPIDIINFMATLSRLSPATINKIINITSQVFDMAIATRYVRYNPCFGVKKPRIKQKVQKTWTQIEINKFLKLKDVKNATCYTAFMIQFTTGMRPGEVCGLRWCDLHYDYLLPTIGINRYGNETDLKNEKAHEKVFLDPKLLIHLEKLKVVHAALYEKNGVVFTEESFINCIPNDMRQMSPEYLGQAFDRICVKNNLEKIRLYDSRHSLGTNMMRDGVNPKFVSEVMRHESVKTTLDIYSHVDDDMKRKATKKYSSRLL